MTNTYLLQVLNQTIEKNTSDLMNEKLIMIDDIIRIKRSLYGFGYTQHNEFLTDSAAGQLFNELYDMDLNQLQLVNAGYEKQVNEHLSAKKLTY